MSVIVGGRPGLRFLLPSYLAAMRQRYQRRSVAGVATDAIWDSASLCLLFIHPRAPNLISLRSAGTMPA